MNRDQKNLIAGGMVNFANILVGVAILLTELSASRGAGDN
jgi:hypothetical protein